MVAFIPIRVGIDGAQGTGKTTLVSDLQRYYGERFAFIPEASRIIAPTFGVRSSSDWGQLLADEVRLAAFFDAEEKWIEERQRATSAFVIDSSLWLIAAYRTQFGCPDHVEAACRASYHLLLRCGISSAVQRDGFRFAGSQAEIDARYQHLVNELFEGEAITLPVGKMRLAAAVARIDDLIVRSSAGMSANA